MKEPDRMEHLDAERIHALLEGELPSRERDASEEHVASCARCRSEVEAWSLLFTELGDLERLEPAGSFGDRVMARVEVSRPMAAARSSPWAAVRRWWSRDRSARHLGPEQLQDLADGAVTGRTAARAGAHVAGCEPCEAGVLGWRRLIAALEALPALAPSAGFAERVMARVRVRARAPKSVPAGFLAWGRALRPTTARGWALAACVLAAPTLVTGAAASFVAMHPLLTAEYLLSYLWWRASDAALLVGATLLDGVAQGVSAVRSYALVDYLATSPAVAAGAALAFSALTLGALWVLYRNLIPAPRASLRHARV